ncbi:MAG TPA: hypothetical protein VKW78_19655 [Terriglobales bacterium]|nr:hypothetical protein [Terriglobales bacterium]
MGRPTALVRPELQNTMLSGRMVAFVDVANFDLITTFASNGKAYGICRPIEWKAATSTRISQVAAVLQFILRGKNAIVARRVTAALPSGSEGKALWMCKADLHQFPGGKEIRTRHDAAIVASGASQVSQCFCWSSGAPLPPCPVSVTTGAAAVPWQELINGEAEGLKD